MTIETKYDMGNKVWFMHDNKVKNAPIIMIDVVIEKYMNCTGVHKTTQYGLYNYPGYYSENKLFPTKEELLKSL